MIKIIVQLLKLTPPPREISMTPNTECLKRSLKLANL